MRASRGTAFGVEERHGGRQRYRDGQRANQPRTPTHDVLRRRRRSEVRVVNNCLQTGLISEGLSALPAPPVPNRYPAAQTHQPTARTKKTCKCNPFQERLKGFEPSTFCMASSAGGALLSNFIPANRSLSGYACRGPFARLSPANHGSLWTQCGPEARGLKQTVCATAPRESDTGSRCERRSTEPKATGSNPVGRATRLGRSCVFAATSLSRARSPVSSLGSS
jgi:hypothetical protein